MKHLYEYICGIPNTDYVYPDNFALSFDRFMELNGVTENTVTPEMCRWFAKHVCEGVNRPPYNKFTDDVPATPEYITEMLKTVDIKVLVKKLNKVLGGDAKTHVEVLFTDNPEGKETFSLSVPRELYDKELIEDTCDKMMWTVTQVWTDSAFSPLKNPKKKDAAFLKQKDKPEITIIVVEPTLADDVTDYVKKDCGGILYHFTEQGAIKSIMRSGLRMKGEDNSYRFTKNKVFFVCGDDEEALGYHLRGVAYSKGYAHGCDELKPTTRVIRVDASGYNVNFYRDTMYGAVKGNIVYSYAYFPPEMITDVTDEIKKKYFLDTEE